MEREIKNTSHSETNEELDLRVQNGGCVKCQCNGWSDTDNDGKCDTIRNNDNTKKCGHAEIDH